VYCCNFASKNTIYACFLEARTDMLVISSTIAYRLSMADSLGSQLRKARIAARLTLRGVEAQAGVSNAYLSQLETAKAENPSPALLRKLAGLYKVSYESLFTAAGYAPGPKEATRDLFLSHSSKDKSVVRELAGAVEAEQFMGRHLTTWIDEAEIRPGESIPGKVTEGLEKSRFIAVVMTPDYFESTSGWTDAEWHSVLHTDPDNRRSRLIPLLVADCPFIPFLLRHLKAIDMRGERFSEGLKQLLAILRDEPLPRPVMHRGQLITPGGRIDRATLVAERAVPEADPDVVTEILYCNLLPMEGLPRYVYSAAIAADLIRTNVKGENSIPSKNRLKQVIRAAQENEGLEPEHRFMPAFRIYEDRVFTFHDLEDPEGPMAAVVDENDVEVVDMASFVRHEDLRKLVISLLNMAIARHLGREGLVIDEDKRGRFFFPDRDGQPHVITWTPRKKKATRMVAKPVMKDDRVLFWRNLGAYVQAIFLANHFYIQVLPTWVITTNGHTAATGPDIGRKVIKWTGPERNMQILFHIRFWTSILRGGKGGPIAIRAGDQFIEVAMVPAHVQQSFGIASDQRDLMRLLDEEAPVIAAEEEERADIVLDATLDEDIEDLDIDETEELVPKEDGDEDQ
jgi:transcriptional regulator with XRE-family HTH domain